MINKYTDLVTFDKKHVWHPYTSMSNPLPSYVVERADGVNIQLKSGETLIDGMSSWWSVLHGYNRPELNKAVTEQLDKVAHVMFGGFTHEPAITLVKKLVSLTPDGLEKVFISDSGSVAVEVAIKMSLQYWQSKEQANKHKLMTVRNGYHGDTFAAMSVCDPVTGMHQIFDKVLMKNIFAPAPTIMIDDPWDDKETEQLEILFAKHHHELAAFIIEPIVQGTGGMRFYHPNYLKTVRQLCDKYQVLFIADEIATGLGRTGKLFACEWADISPDIMCLGKTLTGGYLSLAATLCTTNIAETISNGDASCFMHGPTFMGNPLACSVAIASIDLLLQNNWQAQVKQIESWFKQAIKPLGENKRVKNVRVLGSIAVVETHQSVNVATIQQHFVEQGVWIRPFGKLIYMMPPLIITQEQIETLINAIASALPHDKFFND
ncbi:adenosylmethionine--8-amino-7-oxononanoate transaminase [Thalassotalea sp. 1_MG-2023]|uniref:adenosylmethionine--8-amino-7-oxononanoate transaminase n=1 Tax=Thalassotalea sp. 1_MG-2023 TaxID=3062680 RepID=UPI0026E2E9AC|nr:adenosylmethionine--8-amino-7-oxononanoate transaminase [Thalassotalea sp. 1_MG-2023]MDO6428740.1 adenosylmethionine--8-amino-7-oxononanoate transaminase [Thalassotalea sp. 1_MG-2023]